MAKDFAIYKVYVHRVNQEELYRFLENMPKSTRGLFIREAIERYRRETGLPTGRPEVQSMGISLRTTFEDQFGGEAQE
ncbi:MAG: hypothetical protein A4E61_00015 [Syntrophorhabdus sp. PtaB.Bin184]|nr:MAG: hypothetical protein A4E61_00015 [Syntrophorhabdus sp. PtaB.Bin184]